MKKWFIAYSSSMLDCTRNIKTLKQEHTIQITIHVSLTIYSNLADLRLII